MKPKPIATFKHTSHAKELNKSLQRLQKSLIFVGIAAGSKGDSRKDGPANHLLGFVHEHGSPAANIPARCSASGRRSMLFMSEVTIA